MKGKWPPRAQETGIGRLAPDLMKNRGENSKFRLQGLESEIGEEGEGEGETELKGVKSLLPRDAGGSPTTPKNKDNSNKLGDGTKDIAFDKKTLRISSNMAVDRELERAKKETFTNGEDHQKCLAAFQEIRSQPSIAHEAMREYCQALKTLKTLDARIRGSDFADIWTRRQDSTKIRQKMRRP